MRARLLGTVRAAAVAALALAGAACSSSSGGGSPDAYVGTWTFASGSIVPNCTGITLGNVDLTGDTVAISKVDATHVAMMVSGGGVTCNVTFVVNGSTATAESGQTCSLTESGYSAVLSVSSWVLTPSAGKIDMTMSGTASVSIVSCAPTSTGTMVPASSDAAAAG
jgi:hypothetical protein